MKKIILSICFVLSLATFTYGQYSNATMNGAWLLETEPGDHQYIEFDGNGNISGWGGMSKLSSFGTYSVSGSSITGSLILGVAETLSVAGTLTSATAANMTVMGGPMAMIKVTDMGAAAGTWSGTMKDSAVGGLTKTVTITVNSSGVVTGTTGFTGTVTGKFFIESGKFAGRIIALGESGVWGGSSSQGIRVKKGTFTAPTASGELSFDCSCPGGGFTLTNATASIDSKKKDNGFSLYTNYPNPFSSQTTIGYTLETNANIELVIYDQLGSKVKVLQKGFVQAGTHTVTWDGTNSAGNRTASGMYFYRMSVQGKTLTKHMIKAN